MKVLFLKSFHCDLGKVKDQKMARRTSLLNKYLKRIAEMCKIEKNLSNHIARHTFGILPVTRSIP